MEKHSGEKQLYPGVIGLLVVSYKEDSELRLKTVYQVVSLCGRSS